MAAHVSEAKKQREDETVRMQKAARVKANNIWNRAKPADPEHPYIKTKGVSCHGLRQVGNQLLIPVMDEAGIIHSVQFIKPDGEKFNALVCGLGPTQIEILWKVTKTLKDQPYALRDKNAFQAVGLSADQVETWNNEIKPELQKIKPEVPNK